MSNAAAPQSTPEPTPRMFQEATFKWGASSHTIPADKIIEAIARVEDHLTVFELIDFYNRRHTIPPAKLSLAYHALLTFAGADITTDDVYIGVLGSLGTADMVQGALLGLIQMMTPPGVGEASAGESEPPEKTGGAAASAKKP